MPQPTAAFFECKNPLSLNYYLGFYPSHSCDIFALDHFPTDSDNLPYLTIVGPFSTSAAALAHHRRQSL